MGVNLENRLRKLEAKAPSDEDWQVFRVIGDTDEDCQAAIDRLIASGEARATDRFVARIIVDPAGSREGLSIIGSNNTYGLSIIGEHGGSSVGARE